jgi:hypothetical protein
MMMCWHSDPAFGDEWPDITSQHHTNTHQLQYYHCKKTHKKHTFRFQESVDMIFLTDGIALNFFAVEGDSCFHIVDDCLVLVVV